MLSRCKNFLIHLSLGGYRIFAVLHEESLVPVFFKFSIDHSLDNIESGKNSYCFRKNLEKVLNFGSKSLFKTCDSDLFLYPVLLESLFIYKQHLSEIIWIKKTQLTFLFHCNCKEIWMQCHKAGYHSSCILPFKQSCVTEVWRQVTMEAKFLDHNNGAYAATTATATRTTGKNNSLRLAKQQLCTGIKLFYIS